MQETVCHINSRLQIIPILLFILEGRAIMPTIQSVLVGQKVCHALVLYFYIFLLLIFILVAGANSSIAGASPGLARV